MTKYIVGGYELCEGVIVHLEADEGEEEGEVEDGAPEDPDEGFGWRGKDLEEAEEDAHAEGQDRERYHAEEEFDCVCKVCVCACVCVRMCVCYV